MHKISAQRRARLKASFAVRRVDLDSVAGLDLDGPALAAGDVVAARVVEIGQHRRLERPDGRRAALFVGDEILLACGARYAPDQFEADCPVGVGPAHLAAAGGVAGLVRHSHDRMRAPTAIEILGAAVRADGGRIRLADVALPARSVAPTGTVIGAPPVIAVCGASMNAGKTHTAAVLVHGLTAAGLKVAAVKATGTGSGGDLWFFEDAGAFWVADFTDVGFATTYRADPAAVRLGAERLIAEATSRGAEAVVVEIADGVRQAETAALLEDRGFTDRLSGVVFAAGDALAAAAGVDWLAARGLPVAAVSGVLARAPLTIRETRAAVSAPCYDAAALTQPQIALGLLGGRAPVADVRDAA